MRLTKLFNEFFESEKSGGVILVFVTLLSLALANSPLQLDYIKIWHIDLGGHSLVHWVNDGLMTIFFLVIGLELEREISVGELSNVKKASLPILGAIGGMMMPVIIFMFLNFEDKSFAGAGIPMATDIAFAIGVLSLLGSRVPASLKVFLTALAVIDDLGAIIVISIFYTSNILFSNLFIALAIFVFLIFLNRMKVYSLFPYIIGGVVMWYFMLNSGVHATITGVLLAFTIPSGESERKSPASILEHKIQRPVAYFILPLFALANTAITFGADWQSGLLDSNSMGIIVGLIFGKPLGIFLFSFIGVKLGLALLPCDLKWSNIIGTGFLGGIGFTMSIFITMLAFDSLSMANSSKIAILIASFVAGTIGFIWLNFSLKNKKISETN